MINQTMERCSIPECTDTVFGRFKPDNRLMCIEHGVAYSQEYKKVHKEIGLAGRINRKPQPKLNFAGGCIKCKEGKDILICPDCMMWFAIGNGEL